MRVLTDRLNRVNQGQASDPAETVTMYLHPAFKMDLEEALPILEERAFGLFVVPTGGAPFGVHVPFLVDRRDDGSLHIALHVARANPIHGHIGDDCQVLLACTGPDAYVSPDWYGSENQVPTWIYTAVHVTGRARIMGKNNHLAHVDRLSRLFEARLAPKPPWTTDKVDTRRRDALLSAIVGIELLVEEVHAQKKLIQHKTADQQSSAADGLEGCNDPTAAILAAMIRSDLAAKD